MPAACCSPVPDSIDDDQAARGGAVLDWRVRRANGATQPGARVGIVGSGPIGLCVLLAVRALTDAKAYVTDLVDDRLRWRVLAEPIGPAIPGEMTWWLPSSGSSLWGWTRCLNARASRTRSTRAWNSSSRGALLVIGIPEVDRVSFNINLMRRNELRILNVRRQNECVELAIELVASGRVDVMPLVTHHFSWKNLLAPSNSLAHGATAW